ncbi:hypothetical protein ACFL2H_02055 [Planctomycetota bacterium]
MGFLIECERCSRNVEIPPASAGGSVECECGANVNVPSLSELRLREGKAAYATSSFDEITRQIKSNELPALDHCVMSGKPANDVVEVYLQCETQWVKHTDNSDGWSAALTSLLGIVLPVVIRRKKTTEVLGRQSGIVLPIRIAADEQSRFGRVKQQSRLRKMLAQEPMYAALLKEYPLARVITSRSDWPR